ncbi:TRAP transporter large permease subunit [Noviherbaspirillum denitrificans]|uniref:TRAP transporter large permease protein n=1 Tax=Noviherbaspirillum denitrificans TaxID=1968433 RepID=A0A254T678_9BURK|nr:TRAP transporter large permease subunit [Noviherbaspirillum denitrificans]OWW18160.1 L-dehydroascorbate transporter large permease subunit [Noviherbaspirillum denitrificans]
MTITVFLGSLLGAMALGMPIAFALLASGVALMLLMGLFDAQILAQNLISGADNYPLLAVPFFILAGELMNEGGLSQKIIDIAKAMIGHIRGGLGYVTVIAAIILGSLSGSAVADTAALAAIVLPMMRQAGYDVNRSAGLIAASGIIAPVLPPSVGFIIFGVVAGVSITKLFIAGIVPALLLGLSLTVTWWFLSRGQAETVQPRQPLRNVLEAIVNGVWALLLPVIIIGGLKFGVFTPTEAGVIAAVYAGLVSGVVYRRLDGRTLFNAFVNAAKTTSVVMFLVAASMVASWLITVADLPGEVVELLEPFLGNKILLMFMIMALVFVVGTAMDFVPTVLILTPVLMPVVTAAGIDPVYFGVMFVMNNAIGLITPPVGTVLNVVCGVGRLPIDGVVRGVMPFLVALTVAMFLMTLFPVLVTAPAAWFR